MKKKFDFPFRLAHISDLHFACPSWNPAQFFSKRWLGNLNLLLTRKRQYAHERLDLLPELFKEAAVDYVLITGDLSTTASTQEFKKAREFVERLKDAGLTVVAIPGNHDKYTRRSDKSALFYRTFSDLLSAEELRDLKEHKVARRVLAPNWSLVLLDTALATSLISSQGHFSEAAEKRLDSLLSSLPQDHHVILANHYPFFKGDSHRVTLLRAEALRAQLLRFPAIRLYLHGHAHRSCVADLRSSGYPIVLDSGSTPHHTDGGVNLIELSKEGCAIQVFSWGDAPCWQKSKQVYCPW